MMPSPNFNMKGKLCVLNTCDPCPGQNIGDAPIDETGCPYWWELIVDGTDGSSGIWRGCGVMMTPELILGITKGVHTAARSVQSARNVIAGGFMTLAQDEIEAQKMARAFKAADTATNAKKLIEGGDAE